MSQGSDHAVRGVIEEKTRKEKNETRTVTKLEGGEAGRDITAVFTGRPLSRMQGWIIFLARTKPTVGWIFAPRYSWMIREPLLTRSVLSYRVVALFSLPH